MSTDILPTAEKFLSRREAAGYLTARGLRISASRLAVLATTTDGPPYRIFGRSAVYTTADLNAWANARLHCPGSEQNSADS